MSHHKIEVKDLYYTYSDGNNAVNGINFSIHHGEAVGIIGANGAGKSTLLLLLMGVLSAERGDIVIGDIRMTKKTLALIRQRMGLVFQDADNQLFMPTVYDDVAFGPLNYGLEQSEVEARVMQSLEMVGIPHLKNRAPYKLSGGEKRAASIATVLSMQPDILIMDEPTSSLDPKTRRKVIEMLKGFEHTKIITSHDLDMVLDLCTRTIVIKEGKIFADGQTKKILTDEKLLKECGLELPLTIQTCPICKK